MKRRKFNFRKWCDEFVLAAKGILLTSRERTFWLGFIPSFIFFSMLMNLLSGGLSKFELMAATGFSGTLEILGSTFLSVFGFNQAFLDWLFIFLIAFLQGVLIGLIVFLWKKKKPSAAISKSPKATKPKKANSSSKQTKVSLGEISENSENVEKAGIITGLIALGAGCPTCGTTLLTPLLGAFFSTGSLAAAGIISSVVTALAIIIAVLSLKRLGVEAYVTIINEKYLKRKEQNEKNR